MSPVFKDKRPCDELGALPCKCPLLAVIDIDKPETPYYCVATYNAIESKECKDMYFSRPCSSENAKLCNIFKAFVLSKNL